MTNKHADCVVCGGWVLPVAPDERQVLQHHAVVIQSRKIVDILPIAQAKDEYHAEEWVDRTESIIMPGLINAHTHTGMTLMRGKADDEPLLKWLRDTVWPIENAFASKEEFCEDGALLGLAEMLRGGVTCLSDMYWFPSAGAKAALQVGMRAMIGAIVIDFPSAYGANPDEYLEKGHRIIEHYKDEELLRFSYAPHAPYTVSPEVWLKLKQLSQERNIPIHTHLHETRDECSASKVLDRSNPACHTSDERCHPIEDFNNKGLLSSMFVAAHMVHLTDDEIQLCAQKGVHIAHCPSSNSKLASGFCPVHKLLAAGVNVALGTDSACSNNSLNMLAEMKMAALNAKNISGDASVVPAPTAIRMGTINGARALGMHDVTGSLEVGKYADLIAIDVQTHAGNSPMFDPHSAVVYAAAREDVSDVMVNGKWLLKDKKYCTVDVDNVLRRMSHWRAQIEEQFPSK